jgi:sugar-specific transcriptional regulator TrmB
MKNIEKFLYQLDFSKQEISIYLELLNKGPFSVAEIAKAVKIYRTAVYIHLNNLIEKGVVAKVKGANNKIAANSPESLHILVQQKAIQAEAMHSKLPSIISLLNQSLPTPSHQRQSNIKYFEGKNNIRTIYNDCLKSKNIRSYFNPKEIKKYLPENIGMFEKVLRQNPKMQIFEIVEDSEIARGRANHILTSPRHYWKFLPGDIKLTANDILIYENKVAIISIGDTSEISGLVIENKEYYDNSVQIFDLLWRLLPEPVNK